MLRDLSPGGAVVVVVVPQPERGALGGEHLGLRRAGRGSVWAPGARGAWRTAMWRCQGRREAVETTRAHAGRAGQPRGRAVCGSSGAARRGLVRREPHTAWLGKEKGNSRTRTAFRSGSTARTAPAVRLTRSGTRLGPGHGSGGAGRAGRGRPVGGLSRGREARGSSCGPCPQGRPRTS